MAQDVFHGLEFEITAWIILIGFAHSVGEQREAAGREHLHEHGSSRARQAGYDRDAFGGRRHVDWRSQQRALAWTRGGGFLSVRMRG